MTTVTLLAIILGGIWGLVWALVLQRTYAGKFLAARYTWITVVIGVGADMAIALLIVDWDTWLKVLAVIAASSISIIGRSLRNEWNDQRLLVTMRHEHEDAHRE